MSELLPGQVERIEFNLDQAKCLASFPRSEIFWSFSQLGPMSISEIAKGLGRSANATTYHVNALVEAGLLIVAGERRKNRRTEKLYARAALSFMSVGFKGSPEYRGYAVQQFAAIMRAMVRENALLHDSYEADPSMIDFYLFRRHSIRISRERAQEFRDVIVAAFREFALADVEGDTSVSVAIYMSPTVAESRRVMALEDESED